MNQYSNGAHNNDESCLDKGWGRNIVAGIACGSVRIRDKKTNQIVLDYEHTPGTLIVMEGNFQKEFTHEIPVQKRS